MWKYLPASVCSAERAGSTLPSDSLESKPEPSATSNGTSTVSKSLRPVSKTASSTMPPSGTMSESLTAHPGVEEWISSLPHRPASPTPRQGAEREPAMIGTSSQIHSVWLAKYDLELCMWKTSPDLQLNLKMEGQATSQKSLVNFPRSGMTVDGTLYPRKMLAHRISESAGGSLPKEKQWNTPNTMDSLNCKSQKALDYEYNTARPGRTNPNNLRDQVAVQEGLRLWPTPTGDDANNATRTSGAFQSLTRASGSSPTGQLSATWVCWLMGLPLGWDSLDPLPEGAYAEWLEHMEQGTWWAEERGLPRLAEGQKDRVNRLKCLGNGIVPASGALAFITLEGE